MNLAISIAVGVVAFVAACVTAISIAPAQRGSRATVIRVSASCVIALTIAMVLYIFLED
jgi:hypothetical protein